MAKKKRNREPSAGLRSPESPITSRPDFTRVTLSNRSSSAKTRLLFCLLLFGLMMVVFLPSARNDFVNFDDPIYIYANPYVQQGFTGDAIRWAFTTFEGGFWHPLTWLSIMLDCRLFGVHAGAHHIVSMLLHSMNTVLVFL